MVREPRDVAGVCQRCGGSRTGTRYCPHCGLDFWAAAEQAAPGTAAPTPSEPEPLASSVRLGPIMVAGGIGLLAVAALVWIVAASGVLDDHGAGPQLGQDPPPAVHPVVLAFFKEARDPDAAFAWRHSGRVTVAVPDGEAGARTAAAGRIDGADWAAKMRIVEDDEATFDGEVVLVSQHGYVRLKGETWVETGRIPGAQLGPINPFARITTVAELAYVGPETRDGVDGHILTTEKWLSDPELDDPIRRVAHVRSRESHMEIFVGTDGVPREALYTFALEARTPGGEIVTLAGESHYTFDDWGAVDPIVAPSAKPAP